jgi:hypothetical protein
VKVYGFLVLGAAGALAALAVMSAPGTAQTPGARTFTLSEVTRSAIFRFIDNPPKAFRRGRGSARPETSRRSERRSSMRQSTGRGRSTPPAS